MQDKAWNQDWVWNDEIFLDPMEDETIMERLG